MKNRHVPTYPTRDAGVTLVDLLVAMALLGVIVSLGVGTYNLLNRDTTHGVTRAQVHSTHLDASSLLSRDVADATSISTAEDKLLELSVVRDGTCRVRTYDATGDDFELSTKYFEQEACSGPSETKVEKLFGDSTDATAFTYYNADEITLRQPINDLRDVKRIGWNLASQPEGFDQLIDYDSAAAYNGLGDQSGDGDAIQAKLSTLTVTTGASEGRTSPVLSWTDPNPDGYVDSWVLLRSANPEGKGAADPDRGSWQQVGSTFPVATTTYTDSSLPDGYTATYVVRANLSDGTLGPTSNAVVTGKRPAQVTGLTVTGRATSIDVKWNAAIGATGYDLYRDGVLFATIKTPTTTYTDKTGEWGWAGSGYGHSHNYQVVATNRWESLTTTAAQDGTVPRGATVAQVYPRIGVTRVASASAGAFTSPAAPTVTVTPSADWSFTLGWSPAAWVGSGPASLGGVHRDRGWTADVNGSGTSAANASWAALWSGAENARGTTSRVQAYSKAAVAGQYRHFRVSTCNAIGCSPDSPTATSLQRPPAPGSCTPSNGTTRSMNVTVNPAASNSPYVGYRVTGGVGAADGTGTQASNVFGIDRLAHGTGHTFTALSQNGSPANGGFSDGVSCSGSTAPLTITAPAVSSRTTRSIAASFSAGNGSDRTLTLEGIATIGGTSATFDPLSDGVGYTLTARNSDGYNSVAARASTSTVGLSAPSCSVTGGGTGPNGSITVSSSGSNGDRQVNAGAGWVFASATSRSALGAGSYSGSARATDGHNYTGTVVCGSVNVASPPPPPSDWSSSLPSCSGVGTGQVQSAWLSVHSLQYKTPDWSGMEYKVGAVRADGTNASISWRIQADRRDNSSSDWTSGVTSCGGGNTGV
jgi:hypothetical protein